MDRPQIPMYGSASSSRADSLDYDAGGSMPPPAPTSIIPTGPARKQNVACDACRSKKVRCQRLTINEKCAQCLGRGSECTSNYIEQLHAKQKKGRKPRIEGTKKRRREGEGDTDEEVEAEPGQLQFDSYPASQNLSTFSTYMEGESSRIPGGMNGAEESAQSLHMLAQLAPPTAFTALPISENLSPGEKQENLLRYLFSPYPVTHNEWGYNDVSSIEMCTRGLSDLWEEQNGLVWQEAPSKSHVALSDHGRNELAEELLETYLSIAHPRFPMFDPQSLRNRYAAPSTHPDGPLSHPMIALAVAWGARLSDHPVIARDRAEVSPRDKEHESGRTRSRLVQLLVIRCREVAEVYKIHRIPTLENIQMLIMIEPLCAQVPFLKGKYMPYHFTAAAKLVDALGYNSPEGLLAIQDEKEKIAAVFAWWLVCISDGFRSVFHRTHPNVRDMDSTLRPPDEQLSTNNTAEDAQSVVWFGAASTGASLCRKLCADLWSTRAKSEGISITSLRDFVHANSCWRDNYLARLGVPSKWPDNWDFLAAITAASTDTYYHTLWLVVDHAIRDFGIAELRAGDQKPGSVIEIESVRRRIREESEHGALRIAALTSVLLENGYLRLDPLIIHHPMYEAGLFLAEQGRSECLACVLGLRQYSVTFPQFWECSTEIEELYTLRKAEFSRTGSQSSVSTLLPLIGSSATPSSVSASLSSPKGDEWWAVSRGAELAGNGYTSLPDVRNVLRDGAGHERDVSLALFEWLHHAQ